MTLVIVTPEGRKAGISAERLNRFLEREARNRVDQTITLPPTDYSWGNDTGSSGAPAVEVRL